MRVCGDLCCRALGSLKGVLVVSITVLLCAFSDLPKSSEWRDAVSAPFFESIALMGTPYLPEFLAKQVNFDHTDTALPLGALPKAGNGGANGAAGNDANGANVNGAGNGVNSTKTHRAHAAESNADGKGSLKKDKSNKNHDAGSLKNPKDGAKKRAVKNKSNAKQSP